MKKIIKSLRSGRDGKIIGDNLDFWVVIYEIRMNIKVKDFYFFVLDFILYRMDFLKYSDKRRNGDVNFVRVENFLLFLEEEKIYRESLRIILVRDMVVFFNKFIWMKMCILDYILYEFVEEML